jgi:hypothetical protein
VDPGVLVGSLIKDANTERGMQLLGSAQGPLVLTELVNLEINNALNLLNSVNRLCPQPARPRIADATR